MRSMFRDRRPHAGQGLLETIIALGVIVMGLFAAFTLVLANTRASEAAAFRFEALQLAREGIEVVRGLRDANWIAQTARAWDSGLQGVAGSYAAVAQMNSSTGDWSLRFGVASIDDPLARIVRDRTGGVEVWTQGRAGTIPAAAQTQYRRLLGVYPICASGSIVRSGLPCDASVTPPGPKVGVLVESTVQWRHRGRLQQLTVAEELYDWR